MDRVRGQKRQTRGVICRNWKADEYNPIVTLLRNSSIVASHSMRLPFR